jgi:hypothetical protein
MLRPFGVFSAGLACGLLGLLSAWPVVRAVEIVGYDGKELHYNRERRHHHQAFRAGQAAPGIVASPEEWPLELRFPDRLMKLPRTAPHGQVHMLNGGRRLIRPSHREEEELGAGGTAAAGFRIGPLHDGLRAATGSNATGSPVEVQANIKQWLSRAESCTRRPQNASVHQECKQFMENVCHSLSTQGQDASAMTLHDSCQMFFLHEARDVARATLRKDRRGKSKGEAAREEEPEAPAPAPASAPAPGPVVEEAPIAELGGTAVASEPKALDADADKGKAPPEWWKAVDEAKERPEQGFMGHDVAHVDGDTKTGDWRTEYGPHMQTFQEICASHPRNGWCRAHGYKYSTTPLPRPRAIALWPSRPRILHPAALHPAFLDVPTCWSVSTLWDAQRSVST